MKRAVSLADPYLICMEREESTSPAETVSSFQCRYCGTAKPLTREHWPFEYGKLQTDICRLCSRQRKRAYDKKYRQMRVAARTQDLAALAATPTPTPAKMELLAPSQRDVKKDELAVSQLQVAKALRVGAATLNEHAQVILERVIRYAADSASPHHEWALKLVADRVIPRKLYEDLGAQAAGIKAGQGTIRPSVTIIVQPAAGPAPVEPSVTVVESSAERVEHEALS